MEYYVFGPAVFIYFLRVLEVFLAGAAPCNQMRSRRCSRLKDRRRSRFDLLQNRLIAVSCGANRVSETAGTVPSAGGCPLAGVNGTGVEGRNCQRTPQEPHKELSGLAFLRLMQGRKRGVKTSVTSQSAVSRQASARARASVSSAHHVSFQLRIRDKGHRLTFSQFRIAVAHTDDSHKPTNTHTHTVT